MIEPALINSFMHIEGQSEFQDEAISVWVDSKWNNFIQLFFA